MTRTVLAIAAAALLFAVVVLAIAILTDDTPDMCIRFGMLCGSAKGTR